MTQYAIPVRLLPKSIMIQLYQNIISTQPRVLGIVKMMRSAFLPNDSTRKDIRIAPNIAVKHWSKPKMG